MRQAQFIKTFVAAAALAAPLGGRAAPFECLIQPNQIVEIRSPVEGLISKVHVQRGDSAKAGQVLVELESSAERSAVETAKFRSEMTGRITAAKERFEYASTKLGRTKELQKQNFVAMQAHDDVQAYIDGINQRIQEDTTDPTKLPAEYPALNVTPKPWDASDTEPWT